MPRGGRPPVCEQRDECDEPLCDCAALRLCGPSAARPGCRGHLSPTLVRYGLPWRHCPLLSMSQPWHSHREPSTRYAQLISPHSNDPLKHHLMSGVPTSPCLPLSFIRSRTAAMAAPTRQSKMHRSRDRTRSRSSGGGYARMAWTNLSSSYILGKARIRPSGPT